MIFDSIKLARPFTLIVHFYPLVWNLFKPILQKTLLEKAMEHFQHSATRVTKRLEKGRHSIGVDIWDLVLNQEKKGKEGLSRGEMDCNSTLFMIAGTETTATLLSGLTYLLLSNPKTMTKLVREIRGAFTSDTEISMEALARLPYLNDCIKEALRRYPPVPTGLSHITPADGSTICGHFVPPGVCCNISFPLHNSIVNDLAIIRASCSDN